MHPRVRESPSHVSVPLMEVVKTQEPDIRRIRRVNNVGMIEPLPAATLGTDNSAYPTEAHAHFSEKAQDSMIPRMGLDEHMWASSREEVCASSSHSSEAAEDPDTPGLTTAAASQAAVLERGVNSKEKVGTVAGAFHELLKSASTRETLPDLMEDDMDRNDNSLTFFAGANPPVKDPEHRRGVGTEGKLGLAFLAHTPSQQEFDNSLGSFQGDANCSPTVRDSIGVNLSDSAPRSILRRTGSSSSCGREKRHISFADLQHVRPSAVSDDDEDDFSEPSLGFVREVISLETPARAKRSQVIEGKELQLCDPLSNTPQRGTRSFPARATAPSEMDMTPTGLQCGWQETSPTPPRNVREDDEEDDVRTQPHFHHPTHGLPLSTTDMHRRSAQRDDFTGSRGALPNDRNSTSFVTPSSMQQKVYALESQNLNRWASEELSISPLSTPERYRKPDVVDHTAIPNDTVKSPSTRWPHLSAEHNNFTAPTTRRSEAGSSDLTAQLRHCESNEAATNARGKRQQKKTSSSSHGQPHPRRASSSRIEPADDVAPVFIKPLVHSRQDPQSVTLPQAMVVASDPRHDGAVLFEGGTQSVELLPERLDIRRPIPQECVSSSPARTVNLHDREERTPSQTSSPASFCGGVAVDDVHLDDDIETPRNKGCFASQTREAGALSPSISRSVGTNRVAPDAPVSPSHKVMRNKLVVVMKKKKKKKTPAMEKDAVVQLSLFPRAQSSTPTTERLERLYEHTARSSSLSGPHQQKEPVLRERFRRTLSVASSRSASRRNSVGPRGRSSSVKTSLPMDSSLGVSDPMQSVSPNTHESENRSWKVHTPGMHSTSSSENFWPVIPQSLGEGKEGFPVSKALSGSFSEPFDGVSPALGTLADPSALFDRGPVGITPINIKLFPHLLPRSTPEAHPEPIWKKGEESLTSTSGRHFTGSLSPVPFAGVPVFVAAPIIRLVPDRREGTLSDEGAHVVGRSLSRQALEKQQVQHCTTDRDCGSSRVDSGSILPSTCAAQTEPPNSFNGQIGSLSEASLQKVASSSSHELSTTVPMCVRNSCNSLVGGEEWKTVDTKVGVSPHLSQCPPERNLDKPLRGRQSTLREEVNRRKQESALIASAAAGGVWGAARQEALEDYFGGHINRHVDEASGKSSQLMLQSRESANIAKPTEHKKYNGGLRHKNIPCGQKVSNENVHHPLHPDRQASSKVPNLKKESTSSRSASRNQASHVKREKHRKLNGQCRAEVDLSSHLSSTPLAITPHALRRTPSPVARVPSEERPPSAEYHYPVLEPATEPGDGHLGSNVSKHRNHERGRGISHGNPHKRKSRSVSRGRKRKSSVEKRRHHQRRSRRSEQLMIEYDEALHAALSVAQFTPEQLMSELEQHFQRIERKKQRKEAKRAEKKEKAKRKKARGPSSSPHQNSTALHTEKGKVGQTVGNGRKHVEERLRSYTEEPKRISSRSASTTYEREAADSIREHRIAAIRRALEEIEHDKLSGHAGRSFSHLRAYSDADVYFPGVRQHHYFRDVEDQSLSSAKFSGIPSGPHNIVGGERTTLDARNRMYPTPHKAYNRPDEDSVAFRSHPSTKWEDYVRWAAREPSHTAKTEYPSSSMNPRRMVAVDDEADVPCYKSSDYASYYTATGLTHADIPSQKHLPTGVVMTPRDSHLKQRDTDFTHDGYAPSEMAEATATSRYTAHTIGPSDGINDITIRDVALLTSFARGVKRVSSALRRYGEFL